MGATCYERQHNDEYKDNGDAFFHNVFLLATICRGSNDVFSYGVKKVNNR